jgi:hypothetical protein
MTATRIRPATRLSPLVADQLRRHLPTPDVLTAAQRLGSPDDYCGHNLYVEHEDLFDADLNLVGRNENQVGDVSGFAPPGDMHRVRNTSETTAISIHIRHRHHPHRLERPPLLRLTSSRPQEETNSPDYRRSTSHVTRPSPQLRHLTRRLRHR